MLESAASSPEPAAASDIDDGPAFPLEGIYLDSADRARILALPEIQREEILAERAAENTKRQQDIQLKKALAATQAAASKHQKRKAAAADLDDDAGQRKSSRAKVEKRSVLDDYKKAREAKGAERTSRLDPRRERDRKRRSRSASSASDRDADGESEVEWAPETRREEQPADLKDFERCRVGRSSFAKVCFYPSFETTMKGCFARVSIGLNRETGENMYRMTQIKGQLFQLLQRRSQC
jgi:RNA polymerase-associated protein RTF1